MGNWATQDPDSWSDGKRNEDEDSKPEEKVTNPVESSGIPDESRRGHRATGCLTILVAVGGIVWIIIR